MALMAHTGMTALSCLIGQRLCETLVSIITRCRIGGLRHRAPIPHNTLNSGSNTTLPHSLYHGQIARPSRQQAFTSLIIIIAIIIIIILLLTIITIIIELVQSTHRIPTPFRAVPMERICTHQLPGRRGRSTSRGHQTWTPNLDLPLPTVNKEKRCLRGHYNNIEIF